VSHIDDANTVLAPDLSLKTAIPIPVFMYHYIRDLDEPSDQIGTNLSVSKAVFASEIAKYKSESYKTITFNKYLSGKASSKSIILTFDDGYDDAYTAYNILKQNDFTGIFYIITNRIDTTGYLTSAQIKEMADSGMVIGSHTISHPDLSTTTQEQTLKELTLSKSKLESIIGKPVVDFCYPSGKYTSKTIEVLQNVGYKTAVTTATATKPRFTNFFELPRIRVNHSDTPAGLINRLNSLLNE